MEGILDNLAILGECSLRRLWIELRFPPAQNINLDQFVKDVETHTKDEKITKRTDPVTGVDLYSLANDTQSYTNEIKFIKQSLLESPKTLKTLWSLCPGRKSTITVIVSTLLELKVLEKGFDRTLVWNQRMEDTYSRLDGYVTLLADLQAKCSINPNI